MRSPAEDLRRAWPREGVLRGAALAALALALVAAWWVQRRRETAAMPRLHVEMATAPSALQRDSLAALARAGRAVTWSGPVAAVMAVAEPLREPVAQWRVAAVGDSALVLRDSLGLLDSLARAGVLVTEPTRGPVQVIAGGSMADAAGSGGTVALAGTPEPSPAGRVLVLGRVGWETRFAITALEELGWAVDARLDLGRGLSVQQGSVAPDGARHAVVVVFDSASVRRELTTLQRVLRSGGGVILAGEAARTRSLPPRRDSLALALGDSTVTATAQRIGRGRLLSLDARETWRWRMQGEGSAVESHRAFWSQLVGLATPAAALAPAADAAASAPRAAIVHALGPERPDPRLREAQAIAVPWWLGPFILILLIAEWSSRRRRGVP